MSVKKEGSKDKSKKRSVLKSQSREIVVNVRTYFEEEKVKGCPLIPFEDVIARTAAACRLSENTVINVLGEKKNKTVDEVKLFAPEKKQPHESLLDYCPDYGIRKHIYSYYEREEYPTMKRLVVSLSQAGLFSGSTTTLCHILKNLGFSWKKIRGNRKLLMERNDFIAWRAGFTRSILTVPVERIIWLGETCLNSDHFKRPKRNDETTREPKNSNKGFRLIVIHAGGIEGFVPNAKLLFRGKKISSDYHNDISHLKFKQWFIEQLIPNLKPESIIVMDDAPYHCAQREKYPTIVQSKDEIIAWLTSKNIKFDPTMFKMELLEIVKQQKPQRPIFEIDEIAKEHGHTVLRIPPRHSHFNPIEIMWNQIKDHVAQNSKTSKISEATKLTEEKIINILSQDWEIAVEHTMEVIRTQGALDNIVEERVDNITSATSSSSETEESDNTDEEFSDEEMNVEDFPVRDRRTSGALQTQPKIAHLKCDSTIDEANGNMDIGKLCKQELVEHEEVEVKNEEENENETSILYRRLANSLPDNQKITANNSFVYGDSIIDIGKPCKQEPVDWNEEM